MSTLALGVYEPERPSEVFRWSLAAAVVLAAHLGVAVAYLVLRPESGDRAQAPVIAVEFAPAPVEPPAVPAMPDMTEVQPVEEPQPPPPLQPQSPAETQAMLPPLPIPEQPAVELPPPQKPAAIARPARPPVEQQRVKTTSPKKPAAAAHAPPQRVAAAPNLGADALGAREAQASWRSALTAHLARYKRYPAEAEVRHETGTVRLSFTMDRNGRVLSRHIEGSSGSAALDKEVLSMIERAQPLPPFPPGMPQTRMSLVVPIHFSLR